MASAEQELMLTQTGPNTALGRLLRRYWLPLAVTSELSDEQPVRAVRILSENLVLFRDTTGRVGLTQDRCPHSGYPMEFGQVEETGIACARHGWHFDVEGNCFVLNYTKTVYPMAWAHAKTYPVQRYAGIYWSYLGPPPAPALPAHDILVRRDGRRRITVYPDYDGNWLTAALPGVVQQRGRPDATPETQAATPATGLGAEALWLRLPVDDTHTRHLLVEFIESEDHVSVDPRTEQPEIVHLPREPEPDSEAGRGVADEGRTLLRDLLLRELERSELDHDPLTAGGGLDHPTIGRGPA